MSAEDRLWWWCWIHDCLFSLCGCVLLETKLAILELRMKILLEARRWFYTCLELPLPTLRTRGENASTSFGIRFGYLGRYDVAMIFLGLLPIDPFKPSLCHQRLVIIYTIFQLEKTHWCYLCQDLPRNGIDSEIKRLEFRWEVLLTE